MILTLYKLKSQDFQFVHYPYTPTKVNPAQIAMSPKVIIGMLHRNQRRPGHIPSQSSLATVVYPIVVREREKQLGAVAVSGQDDRWAGMVPYKSQNITLNLASLLRLHTYHKLSFGMQAALHRKSIDLTDAITGSQYSDLLGYNGSIGNGEPMGMLATNFMSLSSGVYWQHLDVDKSMKTEAGASLYNMTRSNQSFIRSRSSSFAYVAYVNRRWWANDKVSFASDLLWSSFNTSHFVSVGGKVSYLLGIGTDEKGVYLHIKHVLGKSTNASVVIHQPRFTIGIGTEWVHYRSKEAQVRPAMELLLTYKLSPHVFGKTKKKIGDKSDEEMDTAENDKKKIRPKKKTKRKIKSKIRKQKTSPKPKNQVKASPILQTPKPPTLTDSVHTKDSSSVVETSIRSVYQITTDSIQQPEIEEKAAPKRRATEVFADKMLKDLEFEFKSTALTVRAQDHLGYFARLLEETPEQKIKIIGHSDNIGLEKSNIAISEQRANMVKEYLVKMGIDASRISTEGQGSRAPLYPNDTELGRSKNRRVEFEFYE